MRKIHFLLVITLWCSLFAGAMHAATFKLNDGRTVSGEVVEAGSNDATALINAGDNKYERVAWGQFSQEDLKGFLKKYAGNKKIVEAVEPLIEATEEERIQKTEVTIKAPPTLPLPPKSSVIGSLFQSGLGIFLLLVIYAANVYAGYEISIFRAQPTALVAGLAAIPGLGFLSNIVFLALPTRVENKAAEEAALAAAAEPTPTIAIPGQEASEAAETAAAAEAAAAGPQPEVFTRGQFTFNKRFFETKFAGFFGMTRKDADKPKVLVFQTSKGEFIAQRITRITPSEIHIQAERGGGASIDMAFQFPEIQTVILKPHA